MKTIFLPLVVDFPDYGIHDGQPRAVILRLDQQLRASFAQAAALVSSEAVDAVEVTLLPQQAVWLDTVGYCGSEDARGVAPIPGWMDNPAADLRLLGANGQMSGEAHEFMEQEVDEEFARFGDHSVHAHRMDAEAYRDAEHPPIQGMRVRIAKCRGRHDGVDFSVHCFSDDWEVTTTVQPMDWYRDVFPEAVPAAQMVEALEKALHVVDEMMLGGLTREGLQALVEQDLKPARAVLRAAQGRDASAPSAAAPSGQATTLSSCPRASGAADASQEERSMQPTFLPFHVDAARADLPVAAILRVDPSVRGQLVRAAALVRNGDLQAVSFHPGADAVRFISKIGYTADNGMAPIAGWMDAPESQLRLANADGAMTEQANAVMNMDLGYAADYDEETTVFDASEMAQWEGLVVTVCGKGKPSFFIAVDAVPGPVATRPQAMSDLPDLFPELEIERAALEGLRAEGWQQVEQLAHGHGFASVPQMLQDWKLKLGDDAFTGAEHERRRGAGAAVARLRGESERPEQEDAATTGSDRARERG